MNVKVRKLQSRHIAYIGRRNICPVMGLHGVQLQRFGFHPDMLISGEFTPGCAVFTSFKQSLEVPDNICMIKIKSYRKNGRLFPLLCVSGRHLTLSGFRPGEPVAIEWELGRITVKRLEVPV